MGKNHLSFSICVSPGQLLKKPWESSANSMDRSQTEPAENFNSYLWENTAKVIPDCLQYRNTASQQFFEVATLLFRSTGDAYYETLDVSRYINDWSELLLKHQHEEVGMSTPVLGSITNSGQFVGRDQIDWIVLGLSFLLNISSQLLKDRGKPLGAP